MRAKNLAFAVSFAALVGSGSLMVASVAQADGIKLNVHIGYGQGYYYQHHYGRYYQGYHHRPFARHYRHPYYRHGPRGYRFRPYYGYRSPPYRGYRRQHYKPGTFGAAVGGYRARPKHGDDRPRHGRAR
jgi:hypothetical protein